MKKLTQIEQDKMLVELERNMKDRLSEISEMISNTMGEGFLEEIDREHNRRQDDIKWKYFLKGSLVTFLACALLFLILKS